jgi:hypothetical protein
MVRIHFGNLITLSLKVCHDHPSGDARSDNLGPTTLSITDYYDQITDEVENKENASFNTTLTDLWGRSISFQMFNAADGGPSKRWNPDTQG